MKKYPNAIQCLRCKTVLVSFDRHDFKQCPCPNMSFVDGGHDYLRVGGKDLGRIAILKLVRVGIAGRKE